MALSNIHKHIYFQLDQTARRLLSEQDRDPYSPTFGCFDRRYWAWKLVDFPEATFQRNVYPIAFLFNDQQSKFFRSPALLSSYQAGWQYAIKIQHKNGSFDQAFPNEYSFGATAFLLHSLLETFFIVKEELDESVCVEIVPCFQKAASFLCHHDEKHGHIANHLAGAAIALFAAADLFKKSQYEKRGNLFLDRVLQHQSPEGWFLEYEGADPGYQTLCLYYLAKVFEKRPTNKLKTALDRALRFLSHFVQTDL